MEIEERPPQITKKLWNIVRIMFYMIRRSTYQKGKSAGKTITNLLHHHRYAALSCRSGDPTTAFISPRDIEFSCSNTPIKPKTHHYQAEELRVMQKVFTILSRYDAVDPSPPPGLRRSPAVESPAAKHNDHDHLQVDRDAEEFIKKFYMELKKQKPVALESPSPYHEWGSYLR